ncbi:uncharacterized protein LOC131402212 isoform X6 [Diceros bicornis minor]|uniref:uncharacterized protein LOC131402212 isoform X6 n=1 Tax=Diceros bicornis minor TaxID=77932 RepID=UPI0026EEA5E0|nr:uncharacterized protein LOC131402212 isoform X6 [Diceros bicornis minor]
MRRTGAQSGRGAGELESCVPRAPEAGSLVRRWQLRWFVWGDWRFLDPSSRIFSAVDLSFLQCGGALGRRRRRGNRPLPPSQPPWRSSPRQAALCAWGLGAGPEGSLP